MEQGLPFSLEPIAYPVNVIDLEQIDSEQEPIVAPRLAKKSQK
jgi:hypothetical protein